MSIVTYENVDTPVFELDTMRYLFRDGLQGMWIDFLPDYAFADTDLTTPTNPGEGIAGYVDRGPYGYNDTQPVITARPILGRVPVGGRRNLLLHTEDFSNPVWVKQGVTVAIAGSEAPPSGLAHELRETSSTGSHRIYQIGIPTSAGEDYTSGFRVKPVGRTRYRIQAGGATGTNILNVDFSAPPAGVIDEGGGWFTVPLSLVSSGTGISDIVLYALNDSGEFSYTGVDGLLAAYISAPQYDDASAELTPYQRVGNQYDVTEAGVPSVYYAHYDGADDVLPSSLTIPSVSEGCFILVGTAGIWIDNEYSNTSGTLSVGPTTYTGGPAGILPVVGDVLSIIVRDEPLTDQERQKVIQAGVKRGSAGLIELGPELVVNGGFSEGMFWSAPVDNVSRKRYYTEDGLVLWDDTGRPETWNFSGQEIPGFISGPSAFVIEAEWTNDSGAEGFVGAWTGITRTLISKVPLVGSRIKRSAVFDMSSGTWTTMELRPAVYANFLPYQSTFHNISLRKLILPGETP